SPRVIVDLSGLDFCDSMGVGVLVTAHGRAMERGGWVRLAAPSGFLRRLLTTLGLTDYLSIHPDGETALADWREVGGVRPDLPASSAATAAPLAPAMSRSGTRANVATAVCS